jgi:hypothetical protein
VTASIDFTLANHIAAMILLGSGRVLTHSQLLGIYAGKHTAPTLFAPYFLALRTDKSSETLNNTTHPILSKLPGSVPSDLLLVHYASISQQLSLSNESGRFPTIELVGDWKHAFTPIQLVRYWILLFFFFLLSANALLLTE